jgi:large subunit ribosomal protein L15
MPLQRRLPKKGFNNNFRTEYNVVNLKVLANFEVGTEITPELLRTRGIVKRRGPIKLLGQGDLTGGYTVKLDAVSTNARAKIEAAGGKVESL